MTIEHLTFPTLHYLYVDREVDMIPDQISAAMGSGFGEVFGFLGANQIQPTSAPMTLYTGMPTGPKMAFRAGAFVSEEDASKVSGPVLAGKIDAGNAVSTIHTGPYSDLNLSHKTLWDHCDANGLVKIMPVWEIYIDDPTQMPADQVKTKLFRAIKS